MIDRATFALTVHELSHAIADICNGARGITIVDEGEHWAQSAFGWPDDVREEFFARSIAAGFLVGDHVSAQDRFLLSVLPQAAREDAAQWCLEHVKPILMQIPPADVIRIAETIAREGKITMTRDEFVQYGLMD